MVSVEELIRDLSPLQYQVIVRLKKQSMEEEEIIKTLKRQFGETWEPPEDLLRSLETKGFVKMQFREGKRIYSLTEKGQSVPLSLNLYR